MTQHVEFSVNDVTFLDISSMSIMIHGNKNDYDREGFQMNVPPASHSKLDPVKVIKCYIKKTASDRPVGKKPLFLALRKQQGHYVALTSSGIRPVL